MRGDGENFNKAAESKEPGAAVASLRSHFLMNLGWSSPRAGGKVLAQGQNLLCNKAAVHSLLTCLCTFTTQLPPPSPTPTFFLLFSNSVPSQLSGAVLLPFTPTCSHLILQSCTGLSSSWLEVAWDLSYAQDFY